MSSLTGLGFPFMFNSQSKTSNVVSGYEKAKADVALTIRMQVWTTLMNPLFGVDFESIMFSEDSSVSEAFVREYIGKVVEQYVESVRYDGVVVQIYPDQRRIDLKLQFSYLVDYQNFTVDYRVMEGDVYV